MNTVDIVKMLCKENDVPISALEKACGFSNGYISSLKKGVIPYPRMEKIADYFDVPVAYLLNSDTGPPKKFYDKETELIAQRIYDSRSLKLLFDIATKSQPEDIQIAYDMLIALKRKEQHD